MKNISLAMLLTSLSLTMMMSISHDEIHNAHSKIVILFTTIEDDCPIGQYWPAEKLHAGQGDSINPSSAFIEPDDWYSNVIESNFELKDEISNYIGYFQDYESGQLIYLYGTKDQIEDLDDEENNTDE